MKRQLCLLIALALGAVACAHSDAATTTTAVPTTTVATTTTTKPVLATLTGLPLGKGVDPHRAVVAVKVENDPAARPLSGFESADVVYEEVVEGGITRFILL